MGLETRHVVSEGALCGVFGSPFAQNLTSIDALVTTTCGHCFAASVYANGWSEMLMQGLLRW
jgi:hypothetical protein